jgi:hypothetical protein
MSQYDLAKSIFSRAFPNEIFVSQSAELWQGDFPLPDTVANYYVDLGASDVSIENYGNPIFLPSLARLWEHQIGYRYDGLTGERIEDWDDDWLVVADEGADPFIYSRSSGKILHTFHGQGEWQPSELFSGLPAMVTSFAILGEIVVSAGDDFTDENSYIYERFIIVAKEELSRVLNSEVEAEAVLDTFGWSR